MMKAHALWRSAGAVIRCIWSRREGCCASVLLLAWLAVCAVSLVWTPYSLWATNGYETWSAPSREHWLGTDGTGADVLSWMMAGSVTNLLIAVLCMAVALAVGLSLVVTMTARRDSVSQIAVVSVDALISVPTVLLALILAVPFGASIAVVVVACGVGYGLNLARVARVPAALALRSSYVESALINGASLWQVWRGHVWGNMRSVVAVQLSMSAGTSILAESGLTYLGIGVPSGTPSWGHCLATSVKFVRVMPWAVVWPGLVVTVVVMALYVFGDVLRDAMDPSCNPMLRRAHEPEVVC